MLFQGAMNQDELAGDGMHAEIFEEDIAQLPECRNDHEFGFVSGITIFVHVVRRRLLSMSNLMSMTSKFRSWARADWMRAKRSTQDVKSPASPATPYYEPRKSPLMRGPLRQTGSKLSDPKEESLDKLDCHKERGRLNAGVV